MTPDEVKWLTWGARRLRPHGAPKWDEPGTRAAIEKHCGSWDLSIATEHVLAHARDPKARTPAAIRGTAPSSTTPERQPRFPAKAGADDECRVHPGEWADSCRICRGPRVVDETPDDRPRRPTEAQPPTEDWKQRRLALATGDTR